MCAWAGEFADNWNCATLNALRAIVDNTEGWHEGPIPPGRQEVYQRHREDQAVALIDLNGLGDANPLPQLSLWLTWYKSRGRTEAAWLLSYSEAPRAPTEDECVAIIRAFVGRKEIEFGEEVEALIHAH